MARDFQIHGEALTSVRFGAHLNSIAAGVQELGLASEGIQITPKFSHMDLNVDDFGPDVPAEVLWMCGEFTISMSLIHYDQDILDLCVAESMGGADITQADPQAGTLQPAGTLMGRGRFPLQSGCHYISLNIASPQLDYPYHFPTAYLKDPPMTFNMGTEKTIARLTWRAIPYAMPDSNVGPSFGETFSSGVVLFDHTVDT